MVPSRIKQNTKYIAQAAETREFRTGIAVSAEGHGEHQNITCRFLLVRPLRLLKWKLLAIFRLIVNNPGSWIDYDKGCYRQQTAPNVPASQKWLAIALPMRYPPLPNFHIAMSAPSGTPGGRFRHRHNRDDTWDSICTICFMTAGTAERLEDLAVNERNHKCILPLDQKRPAPNE